MLPEVLETAAGAEGHLMTWARNWGESRRSIGSTETKRAKCITRKCLDCPSLISGPGKKRCKPCYATILQARAVARSKRQYLAKKAKKAKNGGAA